MSTLPKLTGLATTLLRHPCRPQPFLPITSRRLTTLAIETSCDDTGVCILHRFPCGSTSIQYNRKLTSDNRSFGGVHPAVAVLGHTASLPILLKDAISTGLEGGKPDFVTVTRGPGMAANLATGLNVAKGLSLAWDVPMLAVNHMQGHALTPRLVSVLNSDNGEGEKGDGTTPKPEFPFLSLLVSGGNTMLVLSESVTNHRELVPKLSGVAVGDMLDKTARLLVPGDILAALPDTNYAACLEEFVGEMDYTPPATRAEEIAPAIVTVSGHEFARINAPLAKTRRLSYDFAGLGLQIKWAMGADLTKKGLESRETEIRKALARTAMRLAFEHLAGRVLLVLGGEGGEEIQEAMGRVKTLVVSGGVARNKYLGRVLRGMLDARGYDGIEIVAPPAWLCTDNAAMIAWTGMEMWDLGWRSEMDVLALKNWSVDERKGGGILAVGGWVQR